jgi:hypothetical protein
MEEFQELYSIGVQRRKVAHTGLNDISSRSHAVLSLRVSTDVVKGKLNLIDLAGTSLWMELHMLNLYPCSSPHAMFDCHL